MGTYIYVTRKSDQIDVYDKYFGSYRTVYQRWYFPACQLGLPVAEALFDSDDNFPLDGKDLDTLSCELDVLEKYWDKAFIRSGPFSYATVDLDKVWLREESDGAMNSMREAIRLAQACDGVITIF